MNNVTIKNLKSKVFKYGDGQETLDRIAVLIDGVRVGMVGKTTSSSGKIWFDPYLGTKVISKDFIIQRKKNFEDALAVVVQQAKLVTNG